MRPIERLFLGTFLWACCTGPLNAELAEFDGQRAMGHIAKQLDFGPREPGNLTAKKNTIDYIRQTLEPLADRLTVQSFQAHGLQGSNLWASFEGDSKTTEHIMLGAHWDTRPRAEQDPDRRKRRTPIMGANDGASGVAVLLELAAALAVNRNSVTVDLVFFDLEDMGDIGGRPYSIGASQFIAANPFYRPNAGIIVDMVCDKALSIPREQYSQTLAAPLMNQLWEIGKRQKATAFKDQPGTYITDDHLPFLEAGIPVVDLIHFPFPSYWHSSGDTIDKCSAASLQQVGNVLSDFIGTYGAD